MEEKQCCEKFRTMIGGQALIEGIMMRGPEKDAVVVRTADGLHLEVKDRKLSRPGSFRTWPFFRGIFNFFDAQVTGVNTTDAWDDGDRVGIAIHPEDIHISKKS